MGEVEIFHPLAFRARNRCVFLGFLGRNYFGGLRTLAHSQVAIAEANGHRSVQPDLDPEPAPSGIAPLLRELMNDYAATGLPPAYLPLPTRPAENDHE